MRQAAYQIWEGAVFHTIAGHKKDLMGVRAVDRELSMQLARTAIPAPVQSDAPDARDGVLQGDPMCSELLLPPGTFEQAT